MIKCSEIFIKQVVNNEMSENQYDTITNSVNKFIERFGAWKDKKIVLYGIGQYTAALLSQLKGFHIIGLMDGDKSHLGKEVYGYKVLALEEAEKKADFIIINTSPFYWEMIFQRIEDSRIPIYYANGELAHRKRIAHIIDERCKISLDTMKQRIDCADIVSFDFYDTLVMRLVYGAGDVLKVMEKRICNDFGEKIPFIELRNKAAAELAGKEYTLDEIYQCMEKYVGHVKSKRMKSLELDTEMKLTVARNDMVELYDYAIRKGKEVYILSDMYLSGNIIKTIAAGCGIRVNSDNLWVSCEVGKSKKSGDMWKLFSEKKAGKKIVHFGDSIIGDEEQPKNVGVDAIHIPSAVELLENSALVKITPYINSLHSSLVTGILLNEIFNSPFTYDKTGKVLEIESYGVLGKCIFGDITLTYLLKILSEVKNRKIENLVFLARDGYLLKQSFEILCRKTGMDISSSYLYVSRRAILSAASDKKEAYLSLMKSDYNGSFETYLRDRFDISVDVKDIHRHQECRMPNDFQTIIEWLQPYEEEMNCRLEHDRENYRKYLRNFEWEKKSAVVDICYTGSIQYWLSQVTGTEITGFYFVADLSEENLLNKVNPMISCFQEKEDLKAEKSCIWKNHKLIESLYTAPYGMVKSVDKYGNCETYSSGNNQEHFIEREQINAGINEFIDEYIEICEEIGLDIWSFERDSKFTDTLFGVFFGSDIAYGEKIRKCFWHEDGFINSSKEYSLF